MTWHPLATTKVFAQRKGRIYTVAGHKIAVFKIDNQYYAIDNFCPHAAGALGLGKCQGLVVACPRHNWLFNLETGLCLTFEGFEIDTFKTRVQNGKVEVFMPERS